MKRKFFIHKTKLSHYAISVELPINNLIIEVDDKKQSTLYMWSNEEDKDYINKFLFPETSEYNESNLFMDYQIKELEEISNKYISQYHIENIKKLLEGLRPKFNLWDIHEYKTLYCNLVFDSIGLEAFYNDNGELEVYVTTWKISAWKSFGEKIKSKYPNGNLRIDKENDRVYYHIDTIGTYDNYTIIQKLDKYIREINHIIES